MPPDWESDVAASVTLRRASLLTLSISAEDLQGVSRIICMQAELSRSQLWQLNNVELLADGWIAHRPFCNAVSLFNFALLSPESRWACAFAPVG